ncbi:hypothetical protein PAQ31011_05194 [Pandoraea aquatica]|uniref:Uncharacterized protein n=1 Tax=Pandoraea aquatica TaxID=2508290 RepID=A0A5E4Z851_9BURK|nr:hypothetical protein [Pandoraea aquatica]VVE57264.1 hypothetical protein PAQ31011_05194 [Pandoraea aquatica]
MKSAYALLRKGKIFIQAYSKASTGLWIASGPVYVAEEGGLEEDLGQKVRDALDGSIEGVRHPSQDEWKEIQAPMLEAAGVKSWKTLGKGAKSVGLESNGVTVKMVPSFNYENGGGTPLIEKAIEHEVMNSHLGVELMRAFASCT